MRVSSLAVSGGLAAGLAAGLLASAAALAANEPATCRLGLVKVADAQFDLLLSGGIKLCKAGHEAELPEIAEKVTKKLNNAIAHANKNVVKIGGQTACDPDYSGSAYPLPAVAEGTIATALSGAAIIRFCNGIDD